ncbi:MAG TPA: hypothetical protein VJQ59_04700 [Candidatus Sulfotelmatobacter sp.]|nr:hypothetical protein [Candidatus Sulfotelmatobacter sp.]
MNLQTTKPRARLIRDPEQKHLQFWRVQFGSDVPAFATRLRDATAEAYCLKLARMVEGGRK